MARLPLALRRGLLAVLATAAVGLGGFSIAEACGGFFRARTVSPEQAPSLSREKVLLIHDAARGQQHFVREVAFARADEPFGFVVPTPTRPSVEAVEQSPFTALRRSFPFVKPPPTPRGLAGGGGGIGKGASPGVEVLEQKTVGSFTAFVLAATDEQDLARWLADNGLVSTKQADAWLAHYVRMGFFYVAMRYDPPKDEAETDGPSAAGVIEAETMRISFATPLPYYPYLEPEAAAGPVGVGLGLDPRLLELWYVGADPVVPVALRERGGQQRWVQPLREGEVYPDARSTLEAQLEPELRELLPAGPLVLQTFQDQKSSRAGFQDILFASKVAQPLTPERRAELAPLLGILDPALASGVADEEASP